MYITHACFPLPPQEQSEGDYEKDRLRDQLAQVKEQEEKLEGLMNFLEEEKRRLQDKVEKMTAAGEQHVGCTAPCCGPGWLNVINPRFKATLPPHFQSIFI